MYAVQIQRRECPKLLMNGQRPLYFLAESILWFVYIKIYHSVNNCGKYADGFYNSMGDDKDSHIPSPLIMFTCTTLHHDLLQWQQNKGVRPKASKSKLNADRPDRSNYFNFKDDGGENSSCCAATGRKLLTSPGVVDTDAFLTNTWNTLPESHQQRVYNNTLATVDGQIQQLENPTPALVISLKAARVDNAILLDYLTSEVALEEPEIGRTDPNILIDNNCMNDELHFGMPGGSGDYEDDGEEWDQRDVIPNASRRRRAATERERFDPGTTDVDWYEGEDGDNAVADEEEEALQGDDGSPQNVDN